MSVPPLCFHGGIVWHRMSRLDTPDFLFLSCLQENFETRRRCGKRSTSMLLALHRSATAWLALNSGFSFWYTWCRSIGGFAPRAYVPGTSVLITLLVSSFHHPYCISKSVAQLPRIKMLEPCIFSCEPRKTTAAVYAISRRCNDVCSVCSAT